MTSILKVIGAEARNTITQSTLAVVPFGSVEYHGPHAPLGTDSFIAQELAARIAERLGVVHCPLIAYTTCPVSTQRKPGTISIDAEVMAAYIDNIFRGLFDSGVKAVLALNAHDGNIATLKRAADRVFFDYPDRTVLTVNWWQTLPNSVLEPLALFSGDGGHGHGGPLETSAAWAVAPDSVDLTRAEDYDATAVGRELLTLSYEGRSAEWPGYHGRISECSVEKGETLLKLAEERIVVLVQEWMQNS